MKSNAIDRANNTFRTISAIAFATSGDAADHK
jgi:hypothetical protein